MFRQCMLARTPVLQDSTNLGKNFPEGSRTSACDVMVHSDRRMYVSQYLSLCFPLLYTYFLQRISFPVITSPPRPRPLSLQVLNNKIFRAPSPLSASLLSPLLFFSISGSAGSKASDEEIGGDTGREAAAAKRHRRLQVRSDLPSPRGFGFFLLVSWLLVSFGCDLEWIRRFVSV